MNQTLDAIFHRRAVKVFEPVEISEELREQILNAARHAPSSFNSQPYKFYWVGSGTKKAAVAKLCLGQKPAETASALVVAVADLGSLSVTAQSQLEWMRRSNFTEDKTSRLRAESKDRPDSVHAGAIRNVCRDQTGLLPAAKSADGDRDAAALPAGLVQVGDEEYIVGLPESDDRRRSAGNEHLSDGRL